MMRYLTFRNTWSHTQSSVGGCVCNKQTQPPTEDGVQDHVLRNVKYLMINYWQSSTSKTHRNKQTQPPTEDGVQDHVLRNVKYLMINYWQSSTSKTHRNKQTQPPTDDWVWDHVLRNVKYLTRTGCEIMCYGMLSISQSTSDTFHVLLRS
jgi:hypothetical protein